ncbi:MAG: VWA domain-containing protein [Magnetospiraceae bacterium]
MLALFRNLPIPSLFLLILFALAAHPAKAADDNTVIVLDVSNSMWGQVEGRSKIEIAREVINELMGKWPASRRLGLVAYGHRRAGDCTDIETIFPVGTVDPAKVTSLVNGLTPKGRTPLTEAVRQAAKTLSYIDTPATVILVSDGIESCNADPCALAAELEKSGVDFTAHVVGFDIEGVQDKSQLACLAKETGGKFLTAQTASDLAGALEEVTEAAPPTEAAITLEAVDMPGGEPLRNKLIGWTVVGLDSEATLLDNQAVARPQLKLKPGRYFAKAGLGAATGEVQFEVGEDLKPATHQVVLTVSVTLEAPETAEVDSSISVIWQGPGGTADFLAIAKPDARSSVYASYARLNRGSPTDIAAPKEPGSYEVRYVFGRKREILARVPIEITDLTATISAPKSAPLLSDVEVTWEGPNRNGDFIAIATADSPAGKYLSVERTQQGTPLSIKAPDAPGTYEVRYVTSSGPRVLATAPIEITDIPATVSAADAALAGSDIQVTWTGPDAKNDYITIVTKDTPDDRHGNYTYTRKGNPLALRAPDEPGDYEIRYMYAAGPRPLARQALTVTAAAATLEAPPAASVGAAVSVSWKGPDNKNDYITVVPVGTPDKQHGNYEYTRKGSPVSLRMPDAPGDYELRYVTGQSAATLARLPILLEATAAKLEAPPTAALGSDIQITWTGPDNQNDYITVVPVGTPEKQHGNYQYTRKGSPLTLRLPDQPGDYELRYVMGQSRATLATLPIAIEAVSSGLEAPPTAPIGSEIQVTWTGPGNQNDYITVVPKGTPEKQHGNYQYTRKGNPLPLKMPEEPGEYELRYLLGQSKETLARLAILIEDVQTTLEAAPTSPAGAEIQITWTGPGNQNDYITVVANGTADGKHGNYQYTRKGNPLTLMMPDDPGGFEIRYVTGQSKRVMARLPITIEDVTATLEAPPTGQAGTEMLVTWTGPANRNDYIAIVTQGARDRDSGSYAYTRKGNPARIRLPKAPGAYEIRYVMGQSKRILARLPVTLQ